MVMSIVILLLIHILSGGVLTTKLLDRHDKRVAGFKISENQPFISDANCSYLIGNSKIVRNCSGLISVSKLIYDDYSEPPDIILGSRFFEGFILDEVDLTSNRIKRGVTVNIVTRNVGVQTLSQEWDLGEFTYNEFCLIDHYDGTIKPSIRYVSSGVVELRVVVLTYDILSCGLGGCTYSYRVVPKELLPDVYEEAFDVWLSIFKLVFNYNTSLAFIDDQRFNYEFFISSNDKIGFKELHSFLSVLKGLFSEDLIVIIEVPKPIKFNEDILIAFTYGNYVFLSLRRADIIIHEVGHILGLQHPDVNEFKEPWIYNIFYDSVMLKYSTGNYKKITLGDLAGLARSIYILEGFRMREELDRKLSELGINVGNLCVILPTLRRLYPSKDIPEVILPTIRDGILKFKVDDDGNINYYRFNYEVLAIIKAVIGRYKINNQ